MIQLRPITLPFILTFLLMWNFASAQNDSIINTSIWWSKVEALTPTKVALPDNFDNTQPHTLVIGLHGYGSTAESFLGLYKPFTDAGFIFASPEASYPVLLNNGNLAFEWFLYDISSFIMLERPASELEKRAMRITAEKQMDQIMNDLETQYNINKIIFMGFSQGGIITYLTGIHHHQKVDGIVILSSVVHEDWLGKDNIAAGKELPVLIVQGESDKLVPIEYAEYGRDLMIKNGYEVTYKKFDGAHTVQGELLPFVIDWINKK
ncbi:MAG: hypothetical protein ABFS32_23460 [Bacteroidota bacterium]